jgi:secreted trypsin-like serine protease
MDKVILIFMICLAATTASPLAESKYMDFLSGRVVGGDDAIPHSAPYIVSLRVFWNETVVTPLHICGGSILNANWVLTAGHCLLGIPGRTVVYAGAHDFSEEPTASLQMRSIAEQIIHPDYLGDVEPFDIAVIRVSEPFVFNEFVQTISLPPSDFIHAGDVTVFGWGSTSTTTTPNAPDILQVN